MPEYPAQLGAAAVWAAARHGLPGPGIDLVTGRPVAAKWLFSQLLDHVRPALAEHGDLEVVHRLAAVVGQHGTGAERQRAAAGSGRLREVVTMLSAQTGDCGIDRPWNGYPADHQ